MLIQIKNLNDHPYEIWKAIENKRAEIEWGKTENPPLPKYVIPNVEPPNWIKVWLKGGLESLRP